MATLCCNYLQFIMMCIIIVSKANLRDLIAGTGQVFSPCNLMDDLEKQWGTSPILRQALYIISNPSVNSNWSYSLETLNLGQLWRYFVPYFVPCDLKVWWMTLKNNRAPPLFYIKLCASFQGYEWLQTGVTVQKWQIWVKIGNSLSCMTLKFDR